MRILISVSNSEPTGELRAMLQANGVPNPVIDALLKAIAGANTTSDVSARIYANHMLLAYREYGIEGVVSQTMYLLLNLKRWQGEEAREAKKILNKWIKSTLNG